MGYRKTTHRRIPFGRVARVLRHLHVQVRPVATQTSGVMAWRMSLRATPVALRALRPLLVRQERRRVARLRTAQERRRGTLSLALQRLLLGIALARGGAALVIVRRRHGKPLLADARDRWLHFNASHSDDTLVVALGGPQALGIDIEVRQHRQRRLPEQPPARMLTVWERMHLQALDETERPRAFLQLWTRKEAAAKADGRGLALGFAALEAWGRNAVLRSSKYWRTRDLTLGRNCVGSLAIEARRPGSPTETPPA
ncbi:MAG: 4'-phosphopantetheinyl transferase family protein [Burkholderiales bacterium]